MATSIYNQITEDLKEFGICGCSVNGLNNITFTAQKWIVDDSLVPRETVLYFCFPAREVAKQWASRGQDNVTGIHVCACAKPQEQWIFISDPGEVYVVGQGDDDYENPIDTSSRNRFSTVRCVAGGFAWAVGVNRAVYKRQSVNKWDRITDKPLSTGSKKNSGFFDIDGFSDNDIYACGENGDVWSYDGKKWRQEDIPTNADIERICCAGDGFVYATTNSQELLIGKKGSWRIIKQDITEEPFEEMVSFNSKLLVSTEDAVFELKEEQLIETKLSIPKMTSYSHLAANNKILIVAGQNEACMFDGKQWTRILEATGG